MVNILFKLFLIRDLEIGEIFPFPVWIITFPVCKTRFGLLSKDGKYVVKKFLTPSLEIGEIIPCPVFKSCFEIFGKVGKCFVKDFFSFEDR